MASVAIETSSPAKGSSPLALLSSSLFGASGFCNEICLTGAELAELRSITTSHWLAAIEKACPERVSVFEQAGIERYHLHCASLDHASMWTTFNRTYPAEAVDVIESFSLFHFLRQAFPGCFVTTEMPPYGDLGRPRMYWRLVRPGNGVDVGPAHADYWFNAVLPGWTGQVDGLVRIKIWMPLFLEDAVTGFGCLPGSHLQAYPFKTQKGVDGYPKPAFDSSQLSGQIEAVSSPPGTAIIFSYNLVHQGLNSGDATKTRVSMEFTLGVPRKELEDIYGDLGRFY